MEIDLEHRLTAVESRSKANSHRLDDIEKRQDNLDELVGTVKVLADREERVEEDVKEIKTDVKTMAGKPGQKWDKLWETVLAVIVGAVVGYLLTKAGL